MRRLWGILAVALLAVVLSPPVSAAPIGLAQVSGTVITASELPRELWLPGTGSAYRFTYSTLDRRGVTPCTGMLFVPSGPAPQGGWPVLAWAHGTIGDSDHDAPSRKGVDKKTKAYVTGWLQRGYAIAATDYVGLGTPGVPPYLDGQTAARSVVDSVRAARQLDESLSSRWVVVGLSEGGHAALATAHVATGYAPELDYLGAVASGAPSNIETFAPLGGPLFPPRGLTGLTNFMTFVIAGIRDLHPELGIDSYLTPLGRHLVDVAPELPYNDFKKLTEDVAVSEMLSRSLNDPALLAAVGDYLAVPTSGFDRPMFIAQGIADTVVPIPLTLKLVADMKLQGSHPDFRVYPGDHHGSMYQAEADQAAFVAALFGR